MSRSRAVLALQLQVVLAILTSSGCTNDGDDSRDVVVSELFEICGQVPGDVRIARKIPVDAELISYSGSTSAYEFQVSHYPGDLRRIVGPKIVLGGPLNAVVLGQNSQVTGNPYVLEFDSLGSVLPKAYSSAVIRRGTTSGLFSFVGSWRRCGDGAL